MEFRICAEAAEAGSAVPAETGSVVVQMRAVQIQNPISSDAEAAEAGNVVATEAGSAIVQMRAAQILNPIAAANCGRRKTIIPKQQKLN